MVGKTRFSRNGARAFSWAGRACVLVAGAGATMVLFGGAPASNLLPGPQPLKTPGNTGTEPNPTATSTAFDEFESIGFQLTAWDGPAPVVVDPGTSVETTLTQGNELTYLGIIKMGERQRALMSIDGQQRFLKEGQSVGRVTVVSIADDHVMLREGTASRRINRLAESADRLGYLGNNGSPMRLSDPASRTMEMGLEDPSAARRREIADRMERRGRMEGTPDGPPAGVPAAKARNLKRLSDDGQEGS